MSERRNDIPVVGITGGIGSGKSTVVDIFREYGARVFYADAVAKELLWNDPGVHSSVIAAFGRDITDKDGVIDRRKLAARAFRDRESIDRLNAIIHPEVGTEMRRRIAEVRGGGKYPLIAIEAALIFEANTESRYDVIVSVVADRETRIARIMRRDGIGREDVERRMRFQVGESVHRERADYVIENNGTKEELKEKSKAVLGAIVTGTGRE